jgi:hypothetical protein
VRDGKAGESPRLPGSMSPGRPVTGSPFDDRRQPLCHGAGLRQIRREAASASEAGRDIAAPEAAARPS